MIAALHFLTLVVTTMFAAAAAVLVNWLLLRATFQLMRPATANRSLASRIHLVRGTAQVAQVYAGRR